MLADPRIAKYGDGMAPIKSKVMLSCEECMYKTNYLPWKIVNRRMRDHKRKHHRKDHNDNPMEALTVDWAEDTKQNPEIYLAELFTACNHLNQPNIFSYTVS